MATRTRPVVDSMDWLSINTSCFGVSNAIATTLSSIAQFVRQVRESRSEFDIISSELLSLDAVVELVKDDASSLPPHLARKTPAVLDTCLAILNELEGCVSVLDRSSVSRVDKQSRWIASRNHIATLRWTLAGYRSTLGLAVDLIALNRPRKGIASDDHISLENDADPKSDTANVVGEIRDLTESLEEEARQNGAVAHLQQYLHALHIHALTSVQPVRVEVVNHPQERRQAASSVSDAPDSAIELSDDQASHIGTKQPAPLAYPNIKTPLDEVDELLDGLGERPSDAPVPPPRSSARRAPSNSTSQLQLHERRPSNSGSYSVSISSGNKIVTHHSPQNSGQRTPHTRSWSLSPSETQDSICEGYSTPGTDISGQSDHQSNFSLEKKRPDSETIGQPFDLTRLSGWENPRAEVPVPPVPDMMRSSTSSSSATSQSALPGTARRSSSRLSTALKGLRLGRRSSSRARDGREPEPPQDGEPRPGPVYLEPPRAVFGVSLSDSMQVAKGIGQDGYGSTKSRKANSTRGYPLSVLRCVYFIQERGLQARHIFGQDADHILLAELKEVFSSVDTGYGKIIDWDHFTVHEATNLILLFLAELPEPLVPPAAARRWVSLSRQATISGSMALRLDQGIDFWEEAFLGIHDPSRALLRLLLNMWGVVADMSEFNDMTAERLAGRVIRPLMHLPAARFDTDLMLGLAFMIRKRSEYQVKATGGGRRSNAAF